jgi:hypothetical protein
VLNAVPSEYAIQISSDTLWRARIDERRSPNLDGLCAGDQEFRCIFAACDAAQTNNRNFHCLCSFIHQAQSNRFNRWTGETAKTSPKPRRASLYVYGQRHECVYKRDRIGTSILGSLGEWLR